MFALVRTATEGRKQDGISFLLIDMKTPGLTVRPITGLDGEHDLNEVFFDDVIVPIANRVGAENSGWEVAKSLLELERGGGLAAPEQIGRASCRERVCQYVYISVVAVSLKKKKTKKISQQTNTQ